MSVTLLTRSLLAAALALPPTLTAADATLLGWNNLGMHCMDSDYSVFSILPPYNTIHGQLIVGGRLVTNLTGYTVTYQAVADPDGSFNSTSRGKGNFYQFVLPIYGANLPVDAGLAGFGMPGTSNLPQSFTFDPPYNWFRAEGIPITPYDDAGGKNPYPLMHLVARDANSNVIATTDIVLPVSDEMDCRVCHASGTQAGAQPDAGWAWVDNPERDYRLNILRLHDERQSVLHGGTYSGALAAHGFNSQGLYRSVVADGKPALCAACHRSEALGTAGYTNVPPLTASVHALHAQVTDPDLHLTLDNVNVRAACYRCHPGSTTKCLRGAMGNAIAADGSMAIQCQSCHGSMSAVGAANRVGWLNEPNCQACHTGTATHNNGQIRYTSVFEPNGASRVAVDQTFATTRNAPAAGLSLFRFSTGHGGLKCEACHGSTHAEFPSSHRNDNLRNLALQGHVGVVSECTACHASEPVTVTGGPHGMHPVGQSWVGRHPDVVAGGGAAQCQVCHGTDYRGTVLSRAQAGRSLALESEGGIASINLFRGAEVGCYLCHNGPGGGDLNPGAPPTVSNVSTNTTNGQPVAMALPASGANPLTVRVVSQPAHGSVGLSNGVATYYPGPGFVGSDAFSFAAYDGAQNSSLATGTITVAQGQFSLTAVAHVPPTFPAVWPVPFGGVATPNNLVGTTGYVWSFGDASLPATNQYVTHAYAKAGSYNWTVISSVQAGPTQVSATNTGTILITPPEGLQVAPAQGQWIFTWQRYEGDVLLLWSPVLGPAAGWVVDTNQVTIGSDQVSVTVPDPGGARFYQLRKL